MAEEPLTDKPDRLRSALEPLQELSRQVAEVARSWAAPAGGPAGPSQAATLIRYLEQVSAIPGLAVDPLRRIVEEQRQLAELMASWAEQHRQLAEQLAASAEHLHQLSEDAAAVIDPLLTYAERVSELTRSWTHLIRPQDEEPP